MSKWDAVRAHRAECPVCLADRVCPEQIRLHDAVPCEPLPASGHVLVEEEMRLRELAQARKREAK